jgi:hypothetical protein
MFTPKAMWTLLILFVVCVIIFKVGGELSLGLGSTYNAMGYKINTMGTRINDPLVEYIVQRMFLFGFGFGTLCLIAIMEGGNYYARQIQGKPEPINQYKRWLQGLFFSLKYIKKKLSRQPLIV